MKLSELTSINGQVLKAPQKKLLATLEEKFRLKLQSTFPQSMANPFSGVRVTVDPAIYSLVSFVLSSYQNYSRFGKFSYAGVEFPVSFWDRVKYLVLALHSEAYYDLID